MKRFLLLVLIVVSLLFINLQAIGQSSSSSGANPLPNTTLPTSCDSRLAGSITDPSYPNGCSVDGKSITCCPVKKHEKDAISFGDSLGDDLNDLTISYSVNCTTKKVTFTGGGESDCYGEANTLCGRVGNGKSLSCDLSVVDYSVCCLPENPLITKIDAALSNENRALEHIKEFEDETAVKNIENSLSFLKEFKNVDFKVESVIHNASNESKRTILRNLECATTNDRKAIKALKNDKSRNNEGVLFRDIAKKKMDEAIICKNKILEELGLLLKSEK